MPNATIPVLSIILDGMCNIPYYTRLLSLGILFFLWTVFPSITITALAGPIMMLIMFMCLLSTPHSLIPPLSIASAKSLSDAKHRHSWMYLARVEFLVVNIREVICLFGYCCEEINMFTTVVDIDTTQHNLSYPVHTQTVCMIHLHWEHWFHSLHIIIHLYLVYPFITSFPMDNRFAAMSSLAIQTSPFWSGRCFELLSYSQLIMAWLNVVPPQWIFIVDLSLSLIDCKRSLLLKKWMV